MNKELFEKASVELFKKQDKETQNIILECLKYPIVLKHEERKLLIVANFYITVFQFMNLVNDIMDIVNNKKGKK